MQEARRVGDSTQSVDVNGQTPEAIIKEAQRATEAAWASLPQRWLTATTDSENTLTSPLKTYGYEPFDSLLDKNGKIKIVWRKKVQ